MSSRERMDDEPVLDRARLDAITGGSAALAHELLTALIGEASEMARQIRAAVPVVDGARIAGLLHSLIGIAGNVGAVRLQCAARDLGCADIRDGAALRSGVARMDEELAALAALG
jgi:HPt (histidine-containing phosphotransfer) domain-containing protein